MRFLPRTRFISLPRMSALLAVLLMVTSARGAEWRVVSEELLRTENPGYGGLTCVVVEPTTGDVLVWLSDLGLYRSQDQGVTFRRVNAEPIKGRTEWPGCMALSPRRPDRDWVISTVYGGPILATTDAGATWKRLAKPSEHVDWSGVSWTDEPRLILTLKHESGDQLLASRDGGASFEVVGKGYGPACVFDAKTAVVVRISEGGKRSLVRTTDAARTFLPCGDFATKALPVWRDGKPYWLTTTGIITSSNQGMEWKQIAALKDGRFGPIFGRDEKHLFVITGGGIVESTDGGANWAAPIQLPQGVSGNSPLAWIAYDAKRDVLYAMQMASQLHRLARGAK